VRQRFTVAHELGHILLGHNNRSRVIDYNSKDTNEQQANIFASELLAPLQMLKKECSFSESLTSLADKFLVSKDMMQWRLKSCGLDSRLGSWK
jgi:Zn-dependent peptidase ImmA (M78 family)